MNLVIPVPGLFSDLRRWSSTQKLERLRKSNADVCRASSFCNCLCDRRLACKDHTTRAALMVTAISTGRCLHPSFCRHFVAIRATFLTVERAGQQSSPGQFNIVAGNSSIHSSSSLTACPRCGRPGLYRPGFREFVVKRRRFTLGYVLKASFSFFFFTQKLLFYDFSCMCRPAHLLSGSWWPHAPRGRSVGRHTGWWGGEWAGGSQWVSLVGQRLGRIGLIMTIFSR